MKTRPKLIIFDLDGTLVEFPKDFLMSEVERILPSVGHPPVARSVMEEAFSAFEFFRFLEPSSKDEYLEHYWKAFNWDLYPRSNVFPFSRKVLNALTEAGLDCSLATARTTSEQELRDDLQGTGLLKHISTVGLRAPENKEWMDKAPQISKVLEFHGVKAHEAILVGDIPADVISAKKAGLAGSVAVMSGGIRKDVLAATEPTYLLETVETLPELLLSL